MPPWDCLTSPGPTHPRGALADPGDASPEERHAVESALIEALGAVRRGANVGSTLRAMLAAIKAVRLPAEIVSKNEEKRKQLLDNTREIFEHWKAVMEKPRAQLTADRSAKIHARLNEGYSTRDIKLAIDGCANSAYHRGQNDTGMSYDDLEFICRHGSKIEKFRDLALKRAPEPSDVVVDPEVARLTKLAAELLRDPARVNEYNRVVATLRARGAA